MNAVFAKILEMSLYGSIAILVVLLFRLIFKKLPKRILILFWLVVAFRLICPFNLALPTSVLNAGRPWGGTSEAAESVTLEKHSGAAGLDKGADSIVLENDTAVSNGAISDGKQIVDPEAADARSGKTAKTKDAGTSAFDEEKETLSKSEATVFHIFAIVWIAVVAGLVVLFTVRYILFYSKARWNSRAYDGRYFTTNIETPFVIGFIRPKIFIPVHLDDDEKEYILNHEWTHIKNKDGITKLFSYFVLCVHWFNPLVWLSFVLLCADIEMRVDEETTLSFDLEMVKEYCRSLVEHARFEKRGSFLQQTAFSGLGFGGMETKMRIRNLLKNRKHSKSMMLIAVIVTFSVVLLMSSRSYGTSVETFLEKAGRPLASEKTEPGEESMPSSETASSETLATVNAPDPATTSSPESEMTSETPSESTFPSTSETTDYLMAECAQGYIDIIDSYGRDNDNIRYYLPHIDDDYYPELVISDYTNSYETWEYVLSVYTFKNGQLYTVIESSHVNEKEDWFYCYCPYSNAICSYMVPPGSDENSTPQYFIYRFWMMDLSGEQDGTSIPYDKNAPSWVLTGYETARQTIDHLEIGNIPIDALYERHPFRMLRDPDEDPTDVTDFADLTDFTDTDPYETPSETMPERYQPTRMTIDDYSRYDGTYVAPNGMTTFTFRFEGDQWISISWSFFAGAELREVTLPIEDNICIFYDENAIDRNYNGAIDDDEYILRKGTVELLDDGIKVTLEDITREEFVWDLNVIGMFYRNEYISAQTQYYTFDDRTA